ncbi:DUF1684 domain-containing protein [Spirosoma luteolum]
MRCIALFLACFAVLTAQAQSSTYADTIARHRETYRAEFLKSPGGPLHTADDLSYLRFYAPDARYRVVGTVTRIDRAEPFDMPTYSGTTKPHVAYAVVDFVLNGKPQQLTLYRSLNLMKVPEYRDYLFLPFKDATSGETTYGGGRYMDLRLGDIRQGTVVLDFNKAYNPYCAFADGYACPIPPKANHLSVAIEAGEKVYAKAH